MLTSNIRRPGSASRRAAALHFHKQLGWYSLVAKYEFAAHTRKGVIVERVLTPEVLDMLRDRQLHGHAQGPDLLVWAPDETDFFFCEVKGPGDSLGPEQRRKFAALAAITRRPIRILRCRVPK